MQWATLCVTLDLHLKFSFELEIVALSRFFLLVGIILVLICFSSFAVFILHLLH